MSIKLIWVALIALLAIAMPSWASENLPTSENPAKEKWTKMRPASFAPTNQSAIEQCDRAAASDPYDRLTSAKCDRLAFLLASRQCRKVVVKDGVVFDFMNGRINGHSGLTHGVEKKLGRSDPALLCDLGDRTFAYWFIGDKGKSCNNVGIVFEAPPPALKPTPAPLPPPPPPTKVVETPPPPPPAPKCEWVTERYIVPQPGQIIYIPGLSVAVCYGQVALPSTFVNIPADVMTVTRTEKVCK